MFLIFNGCFVGKSDPLYYGKGSATECNNFSLLRSVLLHLGLLSFNLFCLFFFCIRSEDKSTNLIVTVSIKDKHPCPYVRFWQATISIRPLLAGNHVAFDMYPVNTCPLLLGSYVQTCPLLSSRLSSSSTDVLHGRPY